MRQNPNILVIGAGAVGGIVAGMLKQKGHDVTLVAKNVNAAKKISEQGIELIGFCGNITEKIPTVTRVTDIKKMPDIVLIATKAGDMPQAAKDIAPMLHEQSLVVSLQNGIVEEELATIVGKARTVGCVVGWGATLHSSTKMEMTSKGEFFIGFLDKAKDESLQQLASILSNILPVEISDNILYYLYSKVIINSCISTVGAICGLTLGKMLNQKAYRNVFLAVIDEALNVADAMAWEIPNYAGRLNYYSLHDRTKLRQHLYLRAFGFKYRRLKSSTLQSLERGKKTEVDYFNGFIVKKGRAYRTPTPVNEALIRIVHEIEKGTRVVSEDNILEVWS
ncbi:MAG TPA: 2-dehydropantoate 2-reductase [Bacteroidales bacterium]|nr:2-dehydropantoate 2-reductase [Bacteroidales bacterium]